MTNVRLARRCTVGKRTGLVAMLRSAHRREHTCLAHQGRGRVASVAHVPRALCRNMHLLVNACCT